MEELSFRIVLVGTDKMAARPEKRRWLVRFKDVRVLINGCMLELADPTIASIFLNHDSFRSNCFSDCKFIVLFRRFDVPGSEFEKAAHTVADSVLLVGNCIETQ